MQTTENYIRTITNRNKIGVLMARADYEQIKAFFLQLLDQPSPIPLNTLIGQGHDRFKNVFKSETGWYLYNVKRDLEARGLITSVLPGRKQKLGACAKMPITSIAPSQPAEERSPAVEKVVADKFEELFGKNYVMSYAPGRINLLGEHTDYNDGFVMPAAINRGVHLAIDKSSGDTSLVYSVKYKEYVSIDPRDIQKAAPAAWGNYISGILFRLQQLGYRLTPVNCVFDSDLPEGAGLSSSAAIQCAFTMALNELFDLKLSGPEIVGIVQWAEHHFAGVRSGIMDPFTCLNGRHDHLIHLDCANLHHSYVPLQLDGYCLLICNTNIKHALSASQYNHRREECEKGLKIIRRTYPKVCSLRDVTREMLATSKKKMPPPVHRRVRYVVEENIRVHAATRDLRDGNLAAFGKKMYQTHEGLSYLYEVSCAELDFLVDLTKSWPGILGSRMVGGGFGGCTINIIESGLVGGFVAEAKKAYKEQFKRELTYAVVKTTDGAKVLRTKRKRAAIPG
ncbi:MAG TPA: galactokinase [Chryseosolibacter sp.]|nr:galactokinase [Chryseosolibacter sp.]